MSERERNQKPNSGTLIWIVLILLFVNPLLFIPLGIFGGIGYAVYRAVTGASSSSNTRQTQKNPLDDCPQSPICFHKDKGEHHVARGKEIDPWDRPDIDISKYQRKR